MCSCIQTGKVFPGDGLNDSCHRRHNRLETCLQKQRNVDINTVLFYQVFNSVVELLLWKKTLHRERFFEKALARTSTAHRWKSSKKKLGHSTRRDKNNDQEPHFPTSTTKSRCLRQETKTAVALSHCCSESTKWSIAG